MPCFRLDDGRSVKQPLWLSDLVNVCHSLSAVVSADIHAIQSMGQVPSVAEDLLHFWRRVGPLFLRLR